MCCTFGAAKLDARLTSVCMQVVAACAGAENCGTLAGDGAEYFCEITLKN